MNKIKKIIQGKGVDQTNVNSYDLYDNHLIEISSSLRVDYYNEWTSLGADFYNEWTSGKTSNDKPGSERKDGLEDSSSDKSYPSRHVIKRNRSDNTEADINGPTSYNEIYNRPELNK